MKKKEYHKKHKHFVVFGNLLITYLLAAIIVLFLVFGPPEQTPKDDKKLLWVPEEFVIYQDYLKTIGGTPNIYDVGIIEGTIISLEKSEKCPLQEKNCRIEPYPDDQGIVKIDNIITYNPYPTKNYKELKEGQEVSTKFLLTTRPTKVKYITVYLPPNQISPLQIDSKGNQKIQLEKKIFKPIPKEGGYFVFTTKVFYQKIEGELIPSPGIINEKTLPGLEVGDKFKARISYNGTLYVDEYEIT